MDRATVRRRSGRARRGARTSGRTIVLTRPEGRNERLAARLRALGHDVVVRPLVEIESIETGPIELGDYDWLVLGVDPATLQIRSLTAADQQGGRSTFQFSNYRENTGLADSVFTFKIPRGADVISR